MLLHRELHRTPYASVYDVRHDAPEDDLCSSECSDVFSFNFVVQGRFTVKSCFGESALETGALFLTAPDLEYRTSHDANRWNDVCLSIVLKEWAWPDAAPPRLHRCVVPASFRLHHFQSELRRCLEVGGRLALDAFVTDLVRSLDSPAEPRRFHPVLARRYHEQVQAVQERMRSRPEDDHSLSELAAYADVSPFHLARVFRLMTGETLRQALIRERLNRAKQMLTAGATVTAACFASGFNHLSHFTRTFRRRFGHLPSSYR